MAIPAPYPGLVVRYAYLWHRQFRDGREEGEKDRPCAIILVAETDQNDPRVTVVPITHSPPNDPTFAVELPPATRRRLDLDDAPCWVIADEANRFIWPGPDLRPVRPGAAESFAYGDLPPRLFDAVKRRFLAAARAQRLRGVHRTD